MTLTYRSEYAGAAWQEPPASACCLCRNGSLGISTDCRRWWRHGIPASAALHGAHHRARGRRGLVFRLRCVWSGLTILPSGCCGMAGTWGHEVEHRATSEHIYSLSWARASWRQPGRSGPLLADGYSCRSQAKLIDGVDLPHPLQALLAVIRHPAATGTRAQAPRRDAKTAGLHQTPVDAEAAQMGARLLGKETGSQHA